MACWDSLNIYSSNIRDEDGSDYCGLVQNEYPGCGRCSYCHGSNKHIPERIQKHQNAYDAWREENNLIFRCRWENKSGQNGNFLFCSSSLEKAREVAQKSVFNWTTLFVELFPH